MLEQAPRDAREQSLRAGFSEIPVRGEDNDLDRTGDDRFLVYLGVRR